MPPTIQYFNPPGHALSGASPFPNHSSTARDGPTSPKAAGTPSAFFGYNVCQTGNGFFNGANADSKMRFDQTNIHPNPNEVLLPPQRLMPKPAASRWNRERVVVGMANLTPEAKGAIAKLQEFVQGSKQCPSPGGCSTLQWDSEQRQAGGKGDLEFRFTVMFLLDGIPHTCLGEWHTDKKSAKRDTATQALNLFVDRWGDWLLGLSFGVPDRLQVELAAEHDEAAAEIARAVPEACHLDIFCCGVPECGQPSISTPARPRWRQLCEDGLYKALVDIELLGVKHTFCGCSKNYPDEACADTAKRVLWYLQCRGFETSYHAHFCEEVAKEIPKPPPGWMAHKDMLDKIDKEVVEEKTIKMRTQNRLQQCYADKIGPGEKAISWSYDRTPDKASPVQATAGIPAAGQSFSGGWQKSKREAENDACQRVLDFLEVEFPETRSRGRSRGSSQSNC